MPLGAEVNIDNPRPVQCPDCGEFRMIMVGVNPETQNIQPTITWRCTECGCTETAAPLAKPSRRFNSTERIRFYRRRAAELERELERIRIENAPRNY